ncbi:MAG: fibronectin type III domain-containing protein [Dehalococcoidia bacterium]|nr:fibronectin type III domain-containing protein [Dehalococcoidia bacterium]
MSGINLRKVWIGVAVALSAVAWACAAPAPGPERVHVPVPTLEATPERAPGIPPSTLFVVDRSESSLSVVWESINRATHYDVQRRDSEDGEYAIVATKVAALGLVDEGLQPDSLYYYVVRACNHFGCSEFHDNPVAGLTESDADVGAPVAPKDVKVVKRIVRVLPDHDVVTWTAVEGATYYNVYRAGDLLTKVSAPLTRSLHTDLGRSLGLSSGTSYQVSACNKAGCSPRSQKVFQWRNS